jgi:hypothetical protein
VIQHDIWWSVSLNTPKNLHVYGEFKLKRKSQLFFDWLTLGTHVKLADNLRGLDIENQMIISLLAHEFSWRPEMYFRDFRLTYGSLVTSRPADNRRRTYKGHDSLHFFLYATVLG